MSPRPMGTREAPGSAAARVWAVAARPVAFVVLATVILGGNGLLGSGPVRPGDHPLLVAAALGTAAVLIVAWALLDRVTGGDRAPADRTMIGLLLLLGTVGGVVSTIPTGQAMVGFTVMAAVGAGANLGTGPACGVAAAGILAIEVGSLAFGFTTGEAVGWPLAVVLGVLVGRNRRDVRIQRAQSAALLAQVERTRAEEQRAATLVERARIAREIHDVLAHSLGALAIQLEAAQALLAEDADLERGIQIIGQARRLAASGLADTRQAIRALRTDTPPLPESLVQLIDRHRDVHHQTTDLVMAGQPRPLTSEINLALARTTDEALTNAARHAPGAPVAVHLAYYPDRVTVTVTDTPDPGAAPAPRPDPTGGSGGYGLTGMRERLMLIGGTLTAGPDGTGWTVVAQVPT